MGLFSVRSRLLSRADPRSRPALLARLGVAARAAIRNTAKEAAAGLRDIRLAMIAATDDARIVGVLLLGAAVALGLEMAASFHLI
jgi:hypothetical protein